MYTPAAAHVQVCIIHKLLPHGNNFCQFTLPFTVSDVNSHNQSSQLQTEKKNKNQPQRNSHVQLYTYIK